MNNFYDFIVIGAGISACTFVSSLHKRHSDASILLVEQGRRLGGRSTTRKSRKNIILEFDHGLPSISFGKTISTDLSSLISPLIKSNKLLDITKDILFLNEFGEMKYLSTNERIYRGFPFMINFCEEIIKQALNSKKIHFLFETVAKSITRTNNLWEIKVNNAMLVQSKNLVLSSSLIVHPRCLEIMKIDSLPLREALDKGKDNILDLVISKVSQQDYMQRRNFILYIKNSSEVENFAYNYLQICFSQVIRNNFSFERIVFQKQRDGSLIVVLHCEYEKKHFNSNLEYILKSLNIIFANHQKFLELFLQARLIDQMHWRASQPINNLLPVELQWSSNSNLGFCGDWFDMNGRVGVEGAMNSSIRLAKLVM